MNLCIKVDLYYINIIIILFTIIMNNLPYQITGDIIEYLGIKGILNLSSVNKDYYDLYQPNIKAYLIKFCKESRKKSTYYPMFNYHNHIQISTDNIILYSLHLPYQILDTISEYFDNETILNLSLVNRDYYDLCQSDIKIYLINTYKKTQYFMRFDVNILRIIKGFESIPYA